MIRSSGVLGPEYHYSSGWVPLTCIPSAGLRSGFTAGSTIVIGQGLLGASLVSACRGLLAVLAVGVYGSFVGLQG